MESTVARVLVDPASVPWLQAILDAIPDAVLIVDRHCTIRLINAAYTRLKGVGRDSIGRPLAEVRPAELLPEVIRTGRPKYNLYRNVGGIAYVVNVTPIIADGEIQGAMSVSKDITQVKELSNKILQLERTVRQVHRAQYSFDDILGESPVFRRAVERAIRVSSHDSTVLLRGESGTGKELLAHAIHRASRRSGGPFVVVNCAAIPAELLESELFGYEAGAFTDARRTGKIGLFELADRGTIFLDEIGDMPPGLQAKVLRILQDRKVRRLGGTREIALDVRIIAATNRPLELMIQSGQFREDLYYRLNVVPITLPPLRERPEDIPLIAEHILRRVRVGQAVAFTPDALRQLAAYSWPGNIRELENVVEFAANMAEGRTIETWHLVGRLLRHNQQQVLPESAVSPLREVTAAAERQAIVQALRQFGDTTEGKRQAAEALGISLATLYNKLKGVDSNFLES